MKKNSTLFLLSRMTIRTIKQSWAQFLAIIAIGAIAVTLFVGLLANAQAFEKQVNTAYTDGNLASMWVTTSAVDRGDEDAIRDLVKKECGENAEFDSRFYLPVSINGKFYSMAVTHGLPSVCKPFDVISSENDGQDFLYLDRDLKNQTTMVLDGTINIDVSLSFSSSLSSMTKVLDDYVLEGKKNFLSDGKVTLSSSITGFMSYPENVTKASYNTSVLLVSDSCFKKMLNHVIIENFGEDNYSLVYSLIGNAINFNWYEEEYITNPNQFLIKVKDDSVLDSLKDKIYDYFQAKSVNNLYLITKRSSMPFYITLNNDVTQARQFTFVFPFVFFLVALLVILTTLSQMVLRERKEIGTMKAIGITKKQIYAHYIFLTLTLVAIGILIGEIIGPILIPNILGQKYLLIYTLPTRQYLFPAEWGILTAFVFLFVSGLVTYLTCRKEVSLKPSESMRQAVKKMPFTVDTKSKKQSVIKVSNKMAFRNILTNIPKSLMVIFGVLGCTALLGCGFGIEDTVNYGINHDMNMFYNSDITVTFSQKLSYDEAVNDILSFDGVESVQPDTTETGSMFIKDGPQMTSSIYIIANEEDHPHFKVSFPTYKEPGNPNSTKYVILSQKVAKTINASVGDELTFEMNNETYHAEIYQIYEAFIQHGIIVHRDFFSGDISYSSLSVTLSSGADSDAIEKKINALSYVASSRTQLKWRQYINDVLSGVFVMTNAVKAFAVLLAIVVLYNLSLMNFKERTRDIATLKVLGFTRLEISFSLIMETMLLTFIGVAIGLCLAYPFLLAVMGTNVVELVEYLYYISPLSYFFAFLLTYVLAFVVNLFFSLRTKKIKMVESLKSVE